MLRSDAKQSPVQDQSFHLRRNEAMTEHSPDDDSIVKIDLTTDQNQSGN